MFCALRLIFMITFMMKYRAYCDELLDIFQLLEDFDALLPAPFMMNTPDEMTPTAGKKLPEMNLNALEIIRYNGYPAEQYDVTTEDGYILTIQRIPYGKKGSNVEKPRQPVIIQHGFLCTSVIWIFNAPEKSLGFILADEGYDVWLTNIRGNTYGRRNVRLNPKQKEFWEFSFDEMARYDMPAIIDFVLSKTGFSQLHYIGHSMGTTIAFAMLSSRPEYNDKVRSVMALAPAISTQHITSPIAYLKPFRRDMEFVFNLIGDYEILPNSRLVKFLARTVCKTPVKEICTSLIFIVCGYDAAQLNMTRLPVYLSHIPGGASVQTLMHFLQLMDPGFHRYDFGSTMNIVKYGQSTPPVYKMNKMTAPVAVFWSTNDIVADPTDVNDILVPQIPNLVLQYKVPYDKFTHSDYMWAIDVKELVYNKVIQVLGKLSKD